MNSNSRYCRGFKYLVISPLLSAMALWLAAVFCANGAAIGKTFASPEDAVGALKKAVNNRDTNALAAIFGPAVEEIKSADPVDAQNELTEFAEKLNASNHIAHASNDKFILEVGEDRYPAKRRVVVFRHGGRQRRVDQPAGRPERVGGVEECAGLCRCPA
jgi:Protein of unknown function (DUF2950)